MRIALAFPDLSRDRPEDFMRQAVKLPQKPDLLVLPENAYAITGNNLREFQQLSRQLQDFASNSGIAIITGLGLGGTAGTKLTWLQTDNWALMAKPGGQAAAYHKHTSSLNTAFDGAVWSSAEHLPILELKGGKVGLTICHDLFVSPLQRLQAQQGAEVLINISYANVRSYQWRTLLQAQAITNRVPMLYTLHRNPDTALPQQAIYGFGPQGEFNLQSASGLSLRDIDPDARTGQLYLFDTHQPQQLAALQLQPSRRDWNGSGHIGRDGTVAGKHRHYCMIDLGMDDFLYHPEAMWRRALALRLEVTPAFRICTTPAEYAAHRAEVHAIAPARMIEFGAVAVVQTNKPVAVCYRSSNYKDTFFSEATAGRHLRIDERYLFGPTKTLELLSGTQAEDAAQAERNFRRMVGAPIAVPAPVL